MKKCIICFYLFYLNDTFFSEQSQKKFRQERYMSRFDTCYSIGGNTYSHFELEQIGIEISNYYMRPYTELGSILLSKKGVRIKTIASAQEQIAKGESIWSEEFRKWTLPTIEYFAKKNSINQDTIIYTVLFHPSTELKGKGNCHTLALYIALLNYFFFNSKIDETICVGAVNKEGKIKSVGAFYYKYSYYLHLQNLIENFDELPFITYSSVEEIIPLIEESFQEAFPEYKDKTKSTSLFVTDVDELHDILEKIKNKKLPLIRKGLISTSEFNSVHHLKNTNGKIIMEQNSQKLLEMQKIFLTKLFNLIKKKNDELTKKENKLKKIFSLFITNHFYEKKEFKNIVNFLYDHIYQTFFHEYTFFSIEDSIKLIDFILDDLIMNNKEAEIALTKILDSLFQDKRKDSMGLKNLLTLDYLQAKYKKEEKELTKIKNILNQVIKEEQEEKRKKLDQMENILYKLSSYTIENKKRNEKDNKIKAFNTIKKLYKNKNRNEKIDKGEKIISDIFKKIDKKILQNIFNDFKRMNSEKQNQIRNTIIKKQKIEFDNYFPQKRDINQLSRLSNFLKKNLIKIGITGGIIIALGISCQKNILQLRKFTNFFIKK